MTAQRLALICATENASLLKNRHDTLRKGFETIGQNVRHQIEAIGGAVFEPVLDVIGDLLRRAYDHAMPAAARQRTNQLAHRIAMRARLRERRVEEGVIAVAAVRRHQIVGQARVERK